MTNFGGAHEKQSRQIPPVRRPIRQRRRFCILTFTSKQVPITPHSHHVLNRYRLRPLKLHLLPRRPRFPSRIRFKSNRKRPYRHRPPHIYLHSPRLSQTPPLRPSNP
ncbi:hypothetical protein G7K_1363-t1 [Saitoella complicata NRRL Y-17804]|uniref:Uncharacterized protein n=1 Tax=Saitoella complicata (strain BCRC 22490 / CBS 7301 / JCM 7358 / NBRC 10748 / NRRL Y-17804) TaxID=698492 RepID=A0A0E9NBA0_SAICN|nr:hypothetical protein G7K_1363-t1 [Saitoella complicata NRRL Y-17804]